eukprot:112394_1
MGNARSKSGKQLTVNATGNSNIPGSEIKKIEDTWNDENAFKVSVRSLMIDQLKPDVNQRNNLYEIEQYIDQCLKELAHIKPSFKITLQSKELIYNIIPNLTQHLMNTKAEKKLEFSINYYFQKILILCKYCIELDIECFQLLLIIFGFHTKEANKYKATFYSHCGLPINSQICLSKYGFDEFSTTKTSKHTQTFFIKDNKYYFNPNVYELSYYKSYPNEYFTYCCDIENRSYFQVANINLFGKIGGFNAILNRISNTECCLSVSDAINLIQPIVHLRDLYNHKYFQLLIHTLQNTLLYYYRNLSDITVRSTSFEQVYKLINLLKYMMDRSFPQEIIHEMEIKLKSQFLLRQFKLPFATLRFKAFLEINSVIENVLTQSNKSESTSTIFSIHIKLMREWIENEILINHVFYSEYAMGNKFFIKYLSPVFKLLQFENNSVNVSKYVASYLWLVFYHNGDERVPQDLKHLFNKNCKYLISGYTKQFADKDIFFLNNNVCQIIFIFTFWRVL